MIEQIKKTLEQDPTEETRRELAAMLDGMYVAMDSVSFYDRRPGIQAIDMMLTTCTEWLYSDEARELISQGTAKADKGYQDYIRERTYWKNHDRI